MQPGVLLAWYGEGGKVSYGIEAKTPLWRSCRRKDMVPSVEELQSVDSGKFCAQF